MTDTDEKRFRDADRISQRNRRVLEKLDNARKELNDVKGQIPPHLKQRLEIIYDQIGDLKTEVNNEKSDLKMMKAGAKHQIQTNNQDKHEHRPDE